MNKERLEFQSGNDVCVGYLYRNTKDENLPCVVMGTGFGGTQDTPSLITAANSFADAGFATFTFDYRHLGESGGNPRQLVDISGQQEDFIAAIRFIQSYNGIDGTKLAIWGTSLGGGHVISVAAKTPEVKAVIAQIPFNGFPKKSPRSFGDTISLLRAMYKDKARGKKGKSPLYIPVVGKTGELAVMVGDEVTKSIEGMQAPTWRNETAPRGLFDMMKYKPSNMAKSIKAPVLVCHGEFDKETQGPQTKELISSIPHAEERMYPVSHFAFYEPSIREKVIADQLSFLKKHLA